MPMPLRSIADYLTPDKIVIQSCGNIHFNSSCNCGEMHELSYKYYNVFFLRIRHIK